MAEHPNVELVRRGYAAFAAGDMATVSELFADDIVWHWPGRSALSGDHVGKEAVFRMFAKLAEMAVLRQEIHDVLANDEHAVVLVRNHAERSDGRTFDDRQAHVWHVRDGKAVECWMMGEGDQAAADAFWS
jgi:hypothetical protein